MSKNPRTARAPRAPRTLIALVTTVLLAVTGMLVPAVATAAPTTGTIAGATLDWGVKTSFRNYIASPIAKGTVTKLGAVTGTFNWSGGVGVAAMDGTAASIAFGAQDGVHFQGHEMNGVNALDLTFKNPQLVITSATSARLLLDVDGREFVSMSEPGAPFSLNDVDFATVVLPTPTVSGTTHTWSNAAVSLTAAGSAAFGGFYGEGTVLDPLTLSATITAPVASTVTTLVASPTEVKVGETVTLTANISPSEAAGTVTFSNGTTALGTSPVVGGVATLASSQLAEGSHGLTATFAPQNTAAYAASGSSTVTVTVTTGSVDPEPEPEPEIWNPTIGVFLADGTTPVGETPVYDGDTLIVKGSGFDPEANIGGRGMPVPSNLPQGDYIVFGSFGANWQPSAGAPSDQREVGAQQWALTAETLDQIPDAYRETVRQQWTELRTDGTFTATLAVAAPEAEVEGGNFGVYTYAAGGMKNAAQEKAVVIDYRGARPAQPGADPTLVVNGGSSDSVHPGDEVSFVVKGLDEAQKVRFEVHSDPVDAGSAVADGQGTASLTWTVPTGFAAGGHEVQAFLVDGEGNSALTPFLVSPLKVAAAIVPLDPTKPDPVTPTEPVCVARLVTGGSLSWGLKESFRSYINGPIAKGEFSGGSFTVRSGSVNVDAGDRGQIGFSGRIVATGHNGLLSFQLSSPRIVLNGNGTGSLYAHVSSTDATGKQASNGTVRFATLSFTGATSSGSTLSVNGASTRLTAAGAASFAGFYEAGTALDPVSFQVKLGGSTDCDSISDPAASGSLAVTGSDTPVSLAALSVILLLIGAALVVVRRRRFA